MKGYLSENLSLEGKDSEVLKKTPRLILRTHTKGKKE